MEPNVGRMQWSVVVLLAAIVIGGVVLLAFPRISGKIANNMDDTVNNAFNGKKPLWVNSGEDSDDKDVENNNGSSENEDKFLDEIVFNGKKRRELFEEANVEVFDKDKKQEGVTFIN